MDVALDPPLARSLPEWRKKERGGNRGKGDVHIMTYMYLYMYSAYNVILKYPVALY